MPHDDFTIVCPFFHKALGNILFCEGISGEEGKTDTVCYAKQCFADKKRRNEFMKKYCADFSFCNCKIAAANEKYYFNNL